MLNREIYVFMESLAPYLSGWVFFFTLINLGKIGARLKKSGSAQSHNTFFVEAAGIPLTLLHTVCFVKSIFLQDWLSMLLFVWWGPGFLYVATLYLSRSKQQKSINWHPYKRIICWLCKLNYLLFALVYWHFECYAIIFVFSVWIINDQVMMAWLSDDADRSRRTFHDGWAVRLCYPLALFIPFFFAIPGAWFWQCYGLFLFVLWTAGIYRVYRSSKFMDVPNDQGLLRNMIYFPEAEADYDKCK